ncbi:MAG: hypothetical protein IPG00_11715 [Saprospiraceae bacterium]|nr:hypothetical protein [Saprospiraceae bacterium]
MTTYIQLLSGKVYKHTKCLEEFINQQWSLVAQNLNEGTFIDLDSKLGKAYHYALISKDKSFCE